MKLNFINKLAMEKSAPGNTGNRLRGRSPQGGGAQGQGIREFDRPGFCRADGKWETVILPANIRLRIFASGIA